MTTWLITGTDTDVGKTVITTALRAYYHSTFPQLNIALMKLLQTGEVGDAEFYQQFFSDVVIPLRYNAPLAPPLAAELEGKIIDLNLIYNNMILLQKSHNLLLLEALGGLGSPITRQLTIADIAQQWQLEAILVVPVKLGAIAHTVANVALAKEKQIKLKGIIFNGIKEYSQEDIEKWTPQNLIESLTGVTVLGYFPYLPQVEKTTISQLAKIANQHLSLDPISITN